MHTTTDLPLRWGADAGDWSALKALGLTPDLKPVVCRPGAAVSPSSALANYSKVPSQYNGYQQVVGIPAWTTAETSEHQLAQWAQVADYGICLVLRAAVCFDIDIEDETAAQAAQDAITLAIPMDMPIVRRRVGSARRALVYRSQAGAGLAKSKMHLTSGETVELLAGAQQVLIAGTHSSGKRYYIEGGWPEVDMWSDVELADIRRAWSALAATFGVAEVPLKDRGRGRNDGITTGTESKGTTLPADGITQHLTPLRVGTEGQLYITCPFEDQHTSEGDVTSTVYFPAGTRGYERGNFKCLHAHCAERQHVEFLEALGLADRVEDFGLVPVAPPPPGREVGTMPNGLSRDKSGQIMATLSNLAAVLSSPDACGERIAHDTFTDQIMLADRASDKWSALTETDFTRFRLKLERAGFRPVAREMVRDVIKRVAVEHAFDLAVTWLRSLEWDGEARLDTFYHRYLGVAQSSYTAAVGRYTWTALAGRVLTPGCKADMVPVLVGAQGLGKSTAVEAMTPAEEFYGEISLGVRDADLARMMRGKLVLQISELQGLHSRDMEAIKAFISRPVDAWIPKYEEIERKYPRRCVFFGTTNDQEFLADTTGNRRWLPIAIGTVDVPGIKAIAPQLWAEGRELYLREGVAWDQAQGLAAEVHADYCMSDAWEDILRPWLYTIDDFTGEVPTDAGISTADALMRGLGYSARDIRRSDEMRMARLLRGVFGLRKVRARNSNLWRR